ncbi:MAG: elongation factor P [Candidatus Glassbacteria bacterium]|nr:elongation factor P [Candidatus Glassbacteria bacterium]
MASTADFRNGMVIEIDGELLQIVEFQHVKPGKGGAFVRTKLKRVLRGAVLDKTFRAGEKVDEVRLENRTMQYLYPDGNLYYFMDNNSYEQFPVSADVIGDQVRYLKENIEVTGLFREDSLLMVELPFFVELEVTETDPGIKGDTVSGGTKPAKLESGVTVSVPLFIEVGQKIKVDRRTNEYLERAN